MELHKILISIIVFGVMITAGVLVIADVNTNYDKNISTSEFSDAYNTINDTYDIAVGAKDKMTGGEIDETDTWESMLSGSYSAIRLLKNSFTIVGDIINAIASTVGIPSFFVKAAMAIFTIVVIFGMIYLVFRSRG